MAVNDFSSIYIIIVVGLITAFTRALPYLMFSKTKELPETITYLSRFLPVSIMMILVIYCLRNTDFTANPFGLPEIAAVISVVAVQVIKKNSFLSIFIGTVVYMMFIRI